MARGADLSTLRSEVPKTTHDQRALRHVKRVFGREPQLVPGPKRFSRLRGVCFVRIRFAKGSPIELILFNGLLVAIPPKKRGPW